MTRRPIGSEGAADARPVAVPVAPGGLGGWVVVALLLGCAQIEPEVDPEPASLVRPAAEGCLASDYPIVFSSTRGASMNGLELYAMSLAGDVRQIGNAPRSLAPAWSPDGRSIAFRHQVENIPGVTIWSQLQLIAPDESERVALTPQEALPFDSNGILLPNGPSWSPDGQTLAYAATDGANGYRVWLIARQGGDPWRLAPDLEVSHHSPAWSPEGSKIAYVTSDSGVEELWLLDLDQPEVPPLQLTQGQVQLPRWPRWSPDAKRLAFAALDREPPPAGGRDYELYVLDLDMLDITQLTHDDAHDLHPAWSPDGRRLLAARGRGRGDASVDAFDTLYLNLWLLPLEDPAQAEQLTQQGWMNCGADWFSGQCAPP